jgi:hypothetical protein
MSRRTGPNVQEVQETRRGTSDRTALSLASDTRVCFLTAPKNTQKTTVTQTWGITTMVTDDDVDEAGSSALVGWS